MSFNSLYRVQGNSRKSVQKGEDYLSIPFIGFICPIILRESIASKSSVFQFPLSGSGKTLSERLKRVDFQFPLSGSTTTTLL